MMSGIPVQSPVGGTKRDRSDKKESDCGSALSAKSTLQPSIITTRVMATGSNWRAKEDEISNWDRGCKKFELEGGRGAREGKEGQVRMTCLSDLSPVLAPPLGRRHELHRHWQNRQRLRHRCLWQGRTTPARRPSARHTPRQCCCSYSVRYPRRLRMWSSWSHRALPHRLRMFPGPYSVTARSRVFPSKSGPSRLK